jgi:hypothetical protein
LISVSVTPGPYFFSAAETLPMVESAIAAIAAVSPNFRVILPSQSSF